MAEAREPQINTKDIVLRLDTKVDQLISDVSDLRIIAGTVGSTVTTQIDHETRIRALERFRYAMPSATAVATLAAVVAAAYSIFHG